MNCEQTREQLRLFLAGECDPVTQAELESHLAACEECRRELERLRPLFARLEEDLVDLLRREPRSRQAILGRLQEEQKAAGSRQIVPFWIPWAAAAALALVMGGGFFFKYRENQAVETPKVTKAVKAGAEQKEPQAAKPFDFPPPNKAILEDGTVVQASQKSQWKQLGTREIDLTEGDLWIRVAHGDSPFKVRTVAAVATARGTEFAIEAQTDGPGNASTSVAVFEGTVDLANAQGSASANRGESLLAHENEAPNKQLPRTAIKLLEKVIEHATAEKQRVKAARATVWKIVFEAQIQGNRPEERITRMQEELKRASPEISPLFEVVLANWFWQYFQANQWRFLQRTATAQASGGDFTTWDLPRLYAEIDRHFSRALSNADELKKIPIAAFDDLLVKGTVSDAHRPTLYDFIAWEAMAFYSSGEQAAARTEDFFEVSANSDILAPAATFISWKPETTDTDSPALKAIHLYQDLLKFHQRDTDPTAFLDADMARLVYAKNIVYGENAKARFKAQMESLATQWAKHELSALARYHWAQTLKEEGQWVEARAIAQEGLKAYPQSQGGKLCRGLIGEIEQRSLNVSTERVWAAPWPKLLVRYRNVEEIHFRAIPCDWELFLKRDMPRPENIPWYEKKWREMIHKAPALEWSRKLPPTPDYKEGAAEFPVPDKLPPGFYLIVASHDAGFQETNNYLSVTDVWVSHLALVARSRAGQLEGFVLEAASGEPVDGAQVKAWYQEGDDRKEMPMVATDKEGFFTFGKCPSDWRSCQLLASYGGERIATGPDIQYERIQEPEPAESTLLFTDRAIYRPGQTIQYKGIHFRHDDRASKCELKPGSRVTVYFYDANHQEIAHQDQTANDYGSFSGSFTAPRDRLMGQMMITTDEPASNAFLRVEEYKRPKFEVTLDPPKTECRLDGAVAFQGHATGYSGAVVDGAMVKYRISRSIQWPWWWESFRGWFSPFFSIQTQEIAHGTTQTGADGSFKIGFTARPDRSIPEKNEPTFVYQVFADVTDNAGETRSTDRRVLVGYTALKGVLSAKEWQTDDAPVAVDLKTTTLDDEPQSAEGTVKIHELVAPEKVQRPEILDHFLTGEEMEENRDLSDPSNWPLGPVAAAERFKTDQKGTAAFKFPLKPGLYRAVLETKDKAGKKVSGFLPIRVLNPKASKLNLKIPHLLTMPSESVEPGQNFVALWGTGYSEGRALVEIEHRNQIIQRYWTAADRTQALIKQPVTEDLRGGFTLHVTQVRENRAYLDSRHIEVPWSNKELAVKWEHFTSKLQPGQKETWTAVVKGKGADKAVAEMVATLYDQSLDAFVPHAWPHTIPFFYQDESTLQARFENSAKVFGDAVEWDPSYDYPTITYRAFPEELMVRPDYFNLRGGTFFGGGNVFFSQDSKSASMLPPAFPVSGAMLAKSSLSDASNRGPEEGQGGEFKKRQDLVNVEGSTPSTASANLNQIVPRKNLNETAFFFPHLMSDSNGMVRVAFTIPEALTRWKFMGFAHDQNCRSGFILDQAVTQKDLMVQPNPPRFLREGDELEFTVKVSNLGDQPQQGTVRLTFNNPRTGQAIDKALGNLQPEQAFAIPAKESRGFSWRIAPPDGMEMAGYKAVAAGERMSDGEEGVFPILARRVLVTESLPLPIRGPSEKKFIFKKLLESGGSRTLRNQSATLQMVSNPSWYAVMALPYLMEFPHECSEQTFNRLYANALARHIAQSDPKIRRIFDLWKGTPALDSPLEKNQDLKSVLLQESPWVCQAQDESQSRRNVGILFDDNRLHAELARCEQKLAAMQLDGGAWPWFPGGRSDDYITLYITTGFGRLRHLGVDVPMEMALRSLDRLDRWITRRYQEIEVKDRNDNHLDAMIALYLYGRSFFLQDRPLDGEVREAVDYFLGQARKYWFEVGERQSEGHLALALLRFGDERTAQNIMKSLQEHSVSDEEMGMYWRDTEASWWWNRAPIETQALMIEAFDEVAKDLKSVEECKVWLLKQKQTQDWKTTKATADAVYALLLRGGQNLAADALVEVSVGGETIKPEKVEAGTGFYEKRFSGPEVKPALGEITVKKTDPGVAWGSFHWQYLEEMTKVTPHEGTPLKLKKALFKKTLTKKGPVLEEAKGALTVGDELVVRIELRTDRDMEYVHLKDQRGSGLEPLNVISQYKFQDGLAYYESTRDAASHFFIDYLPKGVYVFEYETRVVHRGVFQTGMAEIQCMYAPEFNSHSESLSLTVR